MRWWFSIWFAEYTIFPLLCNPLFFELKSHKVSQYLVMWKISRKREWWIKQRNLANFVLIKMWNQFHPISSTKYYPHLQPIERTTIYFQHFQHYSAIFSLISCSSISTIAFLIISTKCFNFIQFSCFKISDEFSKSISNIIRFNRKKNDPPKSIFSLSSWSTRSIFFLLFQ